MDQKPGAPRASEQGFPVRGSLAVDRGRGVLRYAIVLAVPPEDVWKAITEPARLAAWYGRVEGDLRVDGDYRALLVPSGWEGDGRVLRCEPPSRLRLESGEVGEARTVDDIELAPEGAGGSRLTLTRTRPSAEALAAYAAGTQLHLENLAAHLAGRGPIDPGPYWAALLPRYEEAAAAQGLRPTG